MEELVRETPITYIAVPIYVVAIIIEIIIGRWKKTAKYEARDTATTLGMVLVASFERVTTAVVYAAILLFFYQFRVYEFDFTLPALVLCFVVGDFFYYWKHRFEHRMRLGWASHVNHHSSQHFNLAVALRQTPTFLFTGLIVVYAPMAIMGFNPLMIGFVSGLNLVYQFWIHTETIGKLPRWYEAVMNTPSHHRVHHSTNPRYLDANYAGTLIIWDRMFGTYVPETEEDACRYGIVKNLTTFNLFTHIFHEWIGMAKDVFQPGIAFGDRVRYIFMPPGWSHDGSRLTTDMIKEQHVRLNPEHSGKPGLPDLAEVRARGGKVPHPAE